MYPFALLNDPPRPAYPQYDAVLAEARRITPQFVDPANLAPETDVVRRRGDDWCTAVLGRPYGWTSRITLLEQYLLIAADQLDVDPPLPTWIVEGRRADAEAQAEKQRRVEAARQRDRDAWAAALAEATVEIDVHHGSHARVRGSLYESLGHAVPRADVYSGTRKVRVHPRGRALCETPGRTRPLDINDDPAPAGTPATCVRCLDWAPKVRATEQPVPRPAAVQLTGPQVELLTDIVTKPQMYLRRWSRWEKTGGVLARLGLATMSGCGPSHSEIVATDAGRAEAIRRGIISPSD